MNVSDIEEDLERGDRTGLQAAFRALVDFPEQEDVEGLEDPETALALLAKVSETLVAKDDMGEMPADIKALLDHMVRGQQMVEGHWYAAGAKFVLSNLDRWRPVFDRTLEKDR